MDLVCNLWKQPPYKGKGPPLLVLGKLRTALRERNRNNRQNLVLWPRSVPRSENLIPRATFLRDKNVWLWKICWIKSLLGLHEHKQKAFKVIQNLLFLHCHPSHRCQHLSLAISYLSLLLSTTQPMWYPHISPHPLTTSTLLVKFT